MRRILRRPVRGLADIRLLAEALHWRLWTDPAGITEKNLAEGPSHVDMDAESEATLAALLKGIRNVGMRAAIPPPLAPLNAARDNNAPRQLRASPPTSPLERRV